MEMKKGIYLHMIQSDKFKDIGISIRFLAQLQEASATLRSLLALMLIDRCEKYPSKKAMSDIQDNLYGTSLRAQTVGYGKAQVLELRCKVLDPIYIEQDAGLLEEVICFLKEVVFHPLLTEEAFQEARSILKAKMLRMQDDPAQFVIHEGLKRAGKGTPLAVSSLGELAILDELTLADIKQAHEKLLTEDRIDFVVCGNCDEAKIQELLTSHMLFEERNDTFESHYAFALQEQAKTEEMTRDIQQSSIFMLWQTNTDICDADYYALRCACAMLGQYPTSLLFQEVREKHSLCYSIYANLISFDGALGVTTGVEKADIEKAVDLIKVQFERIRKGDFDDTLLHVTKAMMLNSLAATKDAMNSLMAHSYQNAVLKQDLSIDERMECIQKVTREQIMAAFEKCSLRLTFILSKEESEDEKNNESTLS